MSKPQFKVGDLIAAIEKSGGVIAVAARAVGCGRNTFYTYMRKHPTLQAAYEEANETNLDVAEAGLAAFMRGQIEGQTTRERMDALKFYLRTKGRTRGYGDRLSVDFDPEKYTDEQLAAIAAGKDPSRL